MKITQEVLANPYCIHHNALQRQILEAASASQDCLEDAGVELIELTEGWLLKAEDGHAYVTSFDVLKRLHELGELPVADSDSVVATLRRCDVFFALALVENDAAHYLFGAEALADGLSAATVMRCGLNAALSAANSYMFGLVFLKARTVFTPGASRLSCRPRARTSGQIIQLYDPESSSHVNKEQQ